MNIWIISTERPSLLHKTHGRMMRANTFAKELADLGHNIILWTSPFLHVEKEFLDINNSTVQISSNLKVELLKTRKGYKKNISLSRIIFARNLGRLFKKKIKNFQKPDIIYCSWPLIELSFEAVKFGQRNNVPVVIDIRDFWPDIFLQPIPSFLKPLAKLIVKGVYGYKTKFTMQNATNIVGVIPKVLKYAESYGRKLKLDDHTVFLAYDETKPSKEEIESADKFWESKGLVESKHVICYLGKIGSRIQRWEEIIEVANRIKNENILFVLCGSGDYSEEMEKKIVSLPNFIFAGYRNKAELYSLLTKSTFGLLPYKNTFDFEDALPNKFGEYLSQGLIILTTLKGQAKSIIEKNNCGFYYTSVDTLADAIINVIYDEKKIIKLKSNSYKLFKSEFNAKKVYYRFYEFLENLELKKDK